MARDEKRTGIAAERAFQGFDGVEIHVICRRVEQEEFGGGAADRP